VTASYAKASWKKTDKNKENKKKQFVFICFSGFYLFS